jgi:hypothetical protein
VFAFLIAAMLAAPPAEPTSAQPTPGTVTIQQDGAADPDPVFADAVQSAILRAQFIPLPAPSHSRYVAVFRVTRTTHGMVTSGTRGSGAGAGVTPGGFGIGVQLPKKDDRLRGLVVTELRVTILLRSDQHAVWGGTAVTAQVDGTRAGAPGAVAAKLADALIAQFPRKLDAPLSVP